MAVVSKAHSLRREDIKKWLKNALIFSSPAILVLLGDLVELVPEGAVWGAVAIALYGMVVDGFKKWLKVNKY